MSTGTKPHQDIFAFVIGAPGSGKGTLCKKLDKELGFKHLSVGDVLREICEQTSPLPDRGTIQHVQQGTLVPVETLSTVLAPEVRNPNHAHRLVIVDGCPRQLNQTEHLEQEFGKPELVLLFNCPEAIARERVLGRKQNRMNDTGSMFAKRYAEFAKENPAIAEHYGAEGKLVEIDSSGDTETSYASLVAALKSRLPATGTLGFKGVPE